MNVNEYRSKGKFFILKQLSTCMLKLKLDPWQQEFLLTEGDKLLCKGRQVGASTICGMDAGEWAVKNDNMNVLMIAPTERQAYALFEKTLDYLLTRYKYSIEHGKNRPTQTRIILKNKTKIYCLPVGIAGVGIRFLTIGRLYADEASRIPKEVWTAITPMLMTTGGHSVYLSTPAGSQGYFADVVTNKNNAFNSFTRFFKSSLEVVEQREICETWTELQKQRALDYLESEKKRMSKLEYAQEYEGKILDELKQFFSTELINKTCCMEDREFKLNELKQ